jgi:DNA-binding phage protein
VGKLKTSKKPRNSSQISLKKHVPFTSKELKNRKLVLETLIDCLQTGDLDSFRDVLISHLITSNKSKLAKKAGIGRRTLYDLMDPKKEFNPELSTVAALIRTIAA